MRRDVEFAAEDGTVLRGYLHAAASGRGAGIVMAHGFSGVKEQIDHYAARFAACGFSVLVYDHRGFGSSAGTPRHDLDPARQLADWQDAITYALGQPEFVGPGVGVWGSSFAGGLALVLAANDCRVECVVAQIPNVSGHRNARRMFDAADSTRLRRAFEADRIARLAGDPPATIPVFSPDPEALCALPPAVGPGYVDAVMRATPSWSNEVTLRSLEQSMQFEPAGWVPYISPTPMLMIVATGDTCTFPDLQLDVYHRAREPKRLLTHRGGHFDTYSTHFDETSRAALDWFGEHLHAYDATSTIRPPVPAHQTPRSTGEHHAHV